MGEPVKRPNFFIIGAPKCGTTSMAGWLAEHPNIHIPAKSPYFFNTDDKYRNILSVRRYERLFSGAGSHHIAVGEASTAYLSSREAVPNILGYADDPRFIVMVRNPAEMAHSLHAQLVFSGVENETDFRAAWALQEERRRGRKIPLFCDQPRTLLYGPMCRVGEQLERLYGRVERQRVLVLLLDDVREDPRREYLRVLRFLGVPDDGRVSFLPLNPHKVRRSPWVGKASYAGYRAVMTMPGVSRAFVPALHILRSLDKSNRDVVRPFRFLRALNEWNSIVVPRPHLDPETGAMLAEYFTDDIRRLERLLGRNLSRWLAMTDPVS